MRTTIKGKIKRSARRLVRRLAKEGENSVAIKWLKQV
ncbi:MAG: hypothetical protein ACFWT2_11795 [Thermoanaerobacterium thermosaccharolyticum]|jgi:hypothetical protein